MDPLTDPIALAPNLVSRFYHGGGRLSELRAAAGHDLPPQACEDWVGSATAAWSPPGTAESAGGLSLLSDGRTLDQLVRDDPVAAVGGTQLPPGSTGVLVKLLDAGVRLPIHCHPSRAFAAEHLGSPFGKAEAWVVVDTFDAGPQPPHIRLGWRDGFDRAELLGLVRGQRTAELLAAMPAHAVAPGQTWFVPAGVPHAIGAGVFMVEVQEPTDFSIVAEWDRFPVDPANAAMGLDWELMINAFDLEPMTPQRLASLRQAPRSLAADGPMRLTALLSVDAESFFRAHRLELDGAAAWPLAGWAVAVVLRGAGSARGATRELPLGRGVTFAVPAAAAAGVQLTGTGLELVVCQAGTQPPVS